MNIRTKMTISSLAFISGCILGIACVVCELSLIFRIITAVLVGISSVCLIVLSRCPFCKKIDCIGVKPFLKENPRCKKCGKRVIDVKN